MLAKHVLSGVVLVPSLCLGVLVEQGRRQKRTLADLGAGVAAGSALLLLGGERAAT